MYATRPGLSFQSSKEEEEERGKYNVLPAAFISGKSAQYNKTSGSNEHLYISIHEREVILPGLT